MSMSIPSRVRFILYLVRFCSSKSCKIQSTVRYGTRGGYHSIRNSGLRHARAGPGSIRAKRRKESVVLVPVPVPGAAPCPYTKRVRVQYSYEWSRYRQMRRSNPMGANSDLLALWPSDAMLQIACNRHTDRQTNITDIAHQLAAVIRACENHSYLPVIKRAREKALLSTGIQFQSRWRRCLSRHQAA